MARPSIHLTTDLRSFFQEEVRLTASRQGLELSSPTAQYLSSVLAKFTDARNYLQAGEADEKGRERASYPTLALLWLEGLSKSFTEQLFHMQHVGDVALFTSGFFGDRIRGSVVDMDYYAAMGGRAYETAGKIRESIASERELNVYFELAANFREFTEIFAELADRTHLGSDKGLLRLYEKWLAGRNERLARMLREAGVMPSKPENE
jgi:hypothetical protein